LTNPGKLNPDAVIAVRQAKPNLGKDPAENLRPRLTVQGA